MVDFTLSRTIEDQDNEQYELSYEVDDIQNLECGTVLGRAFLEWSALVKEWFQAPAASAFQSLLEQDTFLSKNLHRVRCSAAGTEFEIDDAGHEALRQIGIPNQLDLTSHELNNRSFATFLFFGNSVATPTYQRISEICHGVHREYARLALPVSGTTEPEIYFSTRSLTSAEMALDKIKEITA